jgi:hypothetical protein
MTPAPKSMERICTEKDCQRACAPGWNRCFDHVEKWLDRMLGIKAPKPQPELPRWKPAS